MELRRRCCFCFFMELCLLISHAAAQSNSPKADDAVEATILSAPVGGAVTLPCSDRSIMWTREAMNSEHVVTNDPNFGYICTGSLSPRSLRCRDDVAIDRDNGRFITINSVRMEDAGRYICTREDLTNGTVELSVFNSSSIRLLYKTTKGAIPQVIDGKRAVLPSDPVSLYCTAIFSGFSVPDLKVVIYRSGSTFPEQHSHLPIQGGINGAFYDNERVVATAQLKMYGQSNHTVRCEIGNTRGRSSSEVFRLIDGPRFASTKDVQLYWTPTGVQLSCQSESFPRATYKWTYIDVDAVYLLGETSPFLLATKRGRYSCSATNEANNVTTTLTFKVVDEASKSSISLPIVAAFLAILLAILSLSCILVARGKCCKPFQGNPRPNSRMYARAQRFLRRFQFPIDDTHYSNQNVTYTSAPPSYAEVIRTNPMTPTISGKIQDRSTAILPPQSEEQPPAYSEVSLRRNTTIPL